KQQRSQQHYQAQLHGDFHPSRSFGLNSDAGILSIGRPVGHVGGRLGHHGAGFSEKNGTISFVSG
ncbi:MAG: hypothetical protein ACK49R_15125, partial [Planctomycetota bacterium]